MPAILEAKKMNCRVIAVDANPAAAAAKLADKFEPIDLKDVRSLITFAKKLKAGSSGLHAVFTAATDFSASVAAIAEACGLAGHTLEAAKNATDKIRMRSCFLRAGVPSPRFAEFKETDMKEAENLLDKLNLTFPLVIKPADNMGARGCCTVSKKEQLRHALSEAIQFSHSKKVIIEEFIDGEEFSLEGLVFSGKLFITALADRHIRFPPYFVEMGHTIPSRCTTEESEELIRVFSAGVKALGLTNGAVKGDIFLSKANTNGKRKGFAGEIAARLSGGYMSGWTVPYSSGINITRAALKLALGELPYEELKTSAPENAASFRPPLKNTSAERAWISIPGEIAEVYGLEQAAEIPFVKNVFPRLVAGDKVCFPKNNVEKCGNILTAAPSYEKAAEAAEKAVQKILIRLKPYNTETEIFLKGINDGLPNQNAYPPNFFIFKGLTHTKSTKISELLDSCRMEKEKTIIYPSFFKPFLDTAVCPHGKTLKDTLEQTFITEPRLLERLHELNAENTEKAGIVLRRFWTAFIRGGIQGALYLYDSKQI